MNYVSPRSRRLGSARRLRGGPAALRQRSRTARVPLRRRRVPNPEPPSPPPSPPSGTSHARSAAGGAEMPATRRRHARQPVIHLQHALLVFALLQRVRGACDNYTCSNASHPPPSSPEPDNTLAYGMVIGASIAACICVVCGCWTSYATDDNTSAGGEVGLGMAILIGVCVLPFALVTIALAATTLGLGLDGVGGTQAAGIMITGGAVTLSAACVCTGLTMCKVCFCEGAAWCHDGDGIGDPDSCSGFNDCCSGFCSLIAGLLCYPRTLWRRRQEVRRRRELEALGEGTAGPATARAADPTCIAVELEPQPPGEVKTACVSK